MKPCPSAGCGKSARPVRRAATGNGALAWIEAPAVTGQPLLPIAISYRASRRLYFTGRVGSNREPEATARGMVRRETRDAGAARPCGEEARGEPQHRMRVNSWTGHPGRVSVPPVRDAQSPTEAGAGMGAAAAGHPVFLPGEIWTGPCRAGSTLSACRAVGRKEATTTSRCPPRSRISS
jgi:hypothetical protein